MSEVKIKITAQNDSDSAFKKAQANLEGLKTSAASVAASLGTALGFVGVAGVGGLATLVRNAVDGIDAFNDLKDATGASIENISALDNIASRTGTSFETVSSALVKLNQALSTAKPGSDAEKAIKAIGLSVKELKNLDPAEAFQKVALALNGFADDGNKARLTQELFGKSLKEVAPLLKNVAEEGTLVAKTTTAQAEQAEKFNKQLAALKTNATEAARAFASDLLPSLIKINEEMAVGIKISGGLFQALADFSSINPFRSVSGNLQSQREELSGLTKDLERFKKAGADTTAIETAIATVKRKIDFLKQSLSSELVAKFAGIESAAETARLNRGVAPKKSVGDISDGKSTKVGIPKDQISEAQSSLASYVKGLQSTIDKTEELTETQKALDFLKGLGTQGEIPQVRELVQGLAARIDKEKELTAQIKIRRQSSVDESVERQKGNEIYQQRLKGLLDATPTNILKAQIDDVKLLVEQYQTGQISEQLYSEALLTRMGLLNDKTKELKGLSEELNLSFQSAFEDAVVGGKGLQDTIKSLEQDILRLVTRQYVTKPAVDALGGLLNGLTVGGSSNPLASFFSSIFGGARAEGGPVLPGRAYLVGERGPEIIMPKNAGTVLPNGTGIGMGIGNPVTVNLVQNFAPGTDRRTTLQAAADASRALTLAGRNL